MSDYDRGLELGEFIKAEREAGGNPDPRWDIAEEAKKHNKEAFDEFMRGLNDAMK